MHLSCRSCAQTISADDVDLGSGWAKCRQCHAVFPFRTPGEAGRDDGKRPRVALPQRFVVEDRPGGFRLVRKWWSPKYIFLLFFVVVWDGFLAFWYAGAIFGVGKSDAPGAVGVVVLLFPLLHVAVGALLTYTVVCGFVNKTVIDVDMSGVRVKHGPLPWGGNHDLARRDVDQLYCVEKATRNNNSTSTSYTVRARLRDGKSLDFLKDLDDLEQALFVEQEIEDALRIEDRRMAGEVPR